jgi:hypothetical protein
VDGAHGVGWQAAFRRETGGTGGLGGSGGDRADYQFEHSSELVRIVLG